MSKKKAALTIVILAAVIGLAFWGIEALGRGCNCTVPAQDAASTTSATN